MEMTLDHALAIEAKAMVALAFRNGPIEALHAGKPCAVYSGNPAVSHISDEEMKAMMKSASILSIAFCGSEKTTQRLISKTWPWGAVHHALG